MKYLSQLGLDMISRVLKGRIRIEYNLFGGKSEMKEIGYYYIFIS